MVGLQGREKTLMISLSIYTQYRRVTDIQTRCDDKDALSIYMCASRSKISRACRGRAVTVLSCLCGQPVSTHGLSSQFYTDDAQLCLSCRHGHTAVPAESLLVLMTSGVGVKLKVGDKY